MRISVITVCYNSVATIEQTIQSVLSQGYDDLEYIMIDGGSTDGTLKIIDKYKDKIAICLSEPDNGVYDAMNKGLERATGDIVAFLNSDDWYDSGVLHKVKRYFEESRADIVSGNVYFYISGICKKMILDRANREKIFVEAIYPHPALFVKRRLYNEFGKFDTTYITGADTKWIMNAWVKGADILCVDDCFTFFRYGGISTTGEYDTLEQHYQISLSIIRENHLEGMEEKVNDFYHLKRIEAEKDKRIRIAFKKKQIEIKKLFNYNKKYYIWGAGIRGGLCLKMFDALNLPIIGFIDSNKEQDEISGYPVLCPEEMELDNMICITPQNSEQEIQKHLRMMGIKECEYFTYSDMIQWIAALGENI